MNRYSVVMFYKKEVEVISINEQKAKEKAHSGEVEKDYGLICDDQLYDEIELKKEGFLDIEYFKTMNKENNKDFTLEQLQCMEKCFNDDDNYSLYDMIDKLADIISEDENLYTHERMLEIMY